MTVQLGGGLAGFAQEMSGGRQDLDMGYSVQRGRIWIYHSVPIARQVCHTVVLPLEGGVTIPDLKGILRRHWGIPVFMQQLWFGTVELKLGDVISRGWVLVGGIRVRVPSERITLILIRRSSSVLDVLNVFDAEGRPDSRIFNIDGRDLGLPEGSTARRFVFVTNSRTRRTGLVLVCGIAGRGWTGSARGSYHPPIQSVAGDFAAGDKLSLVVPGDIIQVTGVEEEGARFNFALSDIGLGDGERVILLVSSMRSGWLGSVIVESIVGGSTCMAQGRPQLDSAWCRFEPFETLCVVPLGDVIRVTGVARCGVMSVARGDGNDGQRFYFERADIQLGDGEGLILVVLNKRNGRIGQIIVRGGHDGNFFGGSAYGRCYPGDIPGQFQVGDELCIVPLGVQLRVDSVDHMSERVGMYFNFYRSEIGLGIDAVERFVVVNVRTGWIGRVVVWGYQNGGSTGDAHGRYDSGFRQYQFRVGDVLKRLL